MRQTSTGPINGAAILIAGSITGLYVAAVAVVVNFYFMISGSLLKSGTFKLGVTCTNNSDVSSAAGGSWSNSTSSTLFHVFPWEPT